MTADETGEQTPADGHKHNSKTTMTEDGYATVALAAINSAARHGPWRPSIGGNAMSTPTSKIAAGLTERERQKTGTANPLSALYGAPANLSQLSEITSKITSKRDKLKNLSESTRKAIESARAEIEERYQDFGVIREGRLVTRTVPENTVKSMVQREVSKAARTERQKTGEERMRLAAEVRELTAKVESVKDAWGNPLTVAHRRVRNDPQVAVIASNLSGVTAINHAMRDAVTSGSASLAMAAILASEKLTKESRKGLLYSAKDVALALPDVRDEWTKANILTNTVALAEAESELAQAQAEDSRDTSKLLLRVGRLRKDLDAITPDPDDGGKPKPVAKPEPKPAAKPEPKKETPKVTGLSDEVWQQMLDAARIDE